VKFAKIVFWMAGVWGALVLTPLYFIFDTIGRQDPPPITHPSVYYGFVTVGLVWQIAFVVIAMDPKRLRPIMIPCVLEKVGYAASQTTLYLQGRLHRSDLMFGMADLLFAVLFLIAFFKTGSRSPSTTH
jgi:hypothetical protein